MNEVAEPWSVPHARREAKAFLRTLFAGKEYVAVRGRDPALLPHLIALNALSIQVALVRAGEA